MTRASQPTWRFMERSKQRCSGGIFLGGHGLQIVRRELPGLVVRHAEGQQGDARDTAADVSLARSHFGYEPSWDVERGLLEQMKWHRARN